MGQQEEENVRLGQSIQKMQDRLDETFLRASDTKQIGREIIKNTEDLLREANKSICSITQIMSSSREGVVVRIMICMKVFLHYVDIVEIITESNMKRKNIMFVIC